MCWVDQVQEESFPFKSFYRQKRGHFIEYFYCMRKWYLCENKWKNHYILPLAYFQHYICTYFILNGEK